MQNFFVSIVYTDIIFDFCLKGFVVQISIVIDRNEHHFLLFHYCLVDEGVNECIISQTHSHPVKQIEYE